MEPALSRPIERLIGYFVHILEDVVCRGGEIGKWKNE